MLSAETFTQHANVNLMSLLQFITKHVKILLIFVSYLLHNQAWLTKRQQE